MRGRTPMMQQYMAAKDAHPGVLIAMRVGDFYEFYFEDAEVAASVLQITLTGREDAENGRTAMAGVPYHSVEKYLARLIQSGYKVALCDQIEDPKQAKGLVRRAVTRVLTPGTVVEESMVPAGANNYLSAICVLDGKVGLATLDSSTGEFLVTEIEGDAIKDSILQELARIRPAELLLDDQTADLGELVGNAFGTSVTTLEPEDSRRAEKKILLRFNINNLSSFGLDAKPVAVMAANMVLQYAEKGGLKLEHLETIGTYSIDSFMALDPSTRRSLELTTNLSDGSRKFTLLSVLDQTVTSMGARLLRKWIEQPLLDGTAIRQRLDSVQLLSKVNLDRADLRDALKKVGDIERLVGRCATGVATPRDLVALQITIGSLPELQAPLQKVAQGRIAELMPMLGNHSDLATLLARALAPNPPNALRDGGVIADGYDPGLDQLRALSRDGRKFIAELEAKERESTGIPNLKVGYNNVFGYFLEVNKLAADRVPEHYIRKQTVANAERYITAELKEFESAVLSASEKAQNLEAEIFVRIRTRISENSASLLQAAKAIAELDTLCSLAEVAVRRDYRKPEVVEDDVLEIQQGRHPVVEANGASFVPNDLCINNDQRMMILTGPNMSGKSTYLRQSALIVLMAQIGSFVPARSCRLGICDRIFARIGAKDEIAVGQSTFMVEMVESAFILNHASSSSLVILDEVGRGTSTYDGLAIAWAMLEHLHLLGAKTMFATHYHQLNVLADQLKGVANFRASVKEVGDEIVWTHRILPGGTDKSYGVHVAKKAGVPKSVLVRANEILASLESREALPTVVATSNNKLQLALFEPEEPWLAKELKELDVDDMTPLQAITLLGEWKKLIQTN